MRAEDVVLDTSRAIPSMSSTFKVHAGNEELFAGDSRPEFHSFTLSRLQADEPGRLRFSAGSHQPPRTC
jgi:hypothetical protein